MFKSGLKDLEIPIELSERFKKTDFVVGDIESPLNENNEFIFKIGVIFDGVTFLNFDCIEEMFYYISTAKGFNSIYFHNLDFDFLFFIRDLDLPENLEIIQSGNMMLEVKISKKKSFVNSLSILPMSLKKVVSGMFSYEWDSWLNQKDDIFSLNDEELYIYCRRDCFLLYKAVYNIKSIIQKEFGIKSFLTIPSLSLKIYKKHYLEHDIFRSIFRKNFYDEGYYFGGHTEKFVEGSYYFEDLNYYDVNSLYPFIMSKISFGVSEPLFVTPSLDNLKDLYYKEKAIFCEVLINVDCEALRFFPSIKDKRNVYLFGERWYKISEESLKYMFNNGFEKNILDVRTIVYFEKKEKLFEKYVKDLFKFRSFNSAYKVIFKLLLNALYGKFGQKKELIRVTLNANDTTKARKVVSFLQNIISFNDDELKGEQLLTLRKDIAGKVTESARVYMSEFRLLCLKNNIEYIYQDTDSLIVKGNLEGVKDFKGLLCNNTLGLYKRENDKPLKGYIIGQKIYSLKNGLETFIASKGVKGFNYRDGERLGLLLFLKRGKNLKFSVNGEKCYCMILRTPNSKFYNTRFTKFKTLIHKSFFGIQIVPHVISEVRERIDR